MLMGSWYLLFCMEVHIAQFVVYSCHFHCRDAAYNNKQQFINMVSHLLEKNGCQVHHASADVLIVQKAVESATISDTVLVGDDTFITHVWTATTFFPARTKEKHQNP